jgi:hypothetical protein
VACKEQALVEIPQDIPEETEELFVFFLFDLV